MVRRLFSESSKPTVHGNPFSKMSFSNPNSRICPYLSKKLLLRRLRKNIIPK
jgi:hypothetical protein